jgi:TonB-dependent starch-binding outer membrane protein SusC
LNATEYAVLKNEMFANGGDPLPFRNTQLGTGTNWQDSVFRTAPIRNYNLSVQGGTDQSTYSIGGSYFRQEGIVGGPKASFERMNGRVNFQTKMSEKMRFNSVFLYTVRFCIIP